MSEVSRFMKMRTAGPMIYGILKVRLATPAPKRLISYEKANGTPIAHYRVASDV
jgi:hypothetical protein